MADLLVIDDDREVAEPLILFLELQGHTVRYAPDGAAGLEEVRKRFPELILLDIDMPTLSGPEMAYRLLVEDSGRENIPILLVSGVNDLRPIAARIGTPYFVAKPFRLEEIERLTARALKEKRPPRPAEVLRKAA